ncbi:hypothetical protein [Haloplanus rubicundus]|uniref:Uncharacterized protein n=1 Tax=Haloplanus rubicundus TaxID=1547898 RepID=A0A345EG06_9EURY|nr:hypothetical protein [Haloplanus rubicundus]AXG11128.1 hypothetical protein DU484_15405 [Haloplanus rubicundus]
MRHHLRKAREIYAGGGLRTVVGSALRYAPVEFNNAVFHLRHGNGTHVMAEDWDNLLILDGCRYDLFEETVDMDGTLESRISLGSSSEEFLERNFGGKTFHDTVYVNANPYIPRLNLDRDTFHAVIDCLDDWEPNLQTIPPEPVADALREANADFPDKRLVGHFMQPHAPFIGKLGQRIVGGGWRSDESGEGEQGIWNYLRDGTADVDLGTVWDAYRENLEVVLESVEALLDELDGKTVITADHGNLVGERLGPIPTRRKYGHPYGVHAPGLVRVPWFVVPFDDRREITADPPIDRGSTADQETVEQRLDALGYK